MRFFHLGDLHIGRYFKDIYLLEDQKEILGHITEKAAELKPDFILIAGDIFDRAIPREDAIKVYEDFITELVLNQRIPVYAISGNHDSALRVAGMGNLLRKAGYHIEGTLSHPVSTVELMDEWGPVKLIFLPFKDRDGLRAFYRKHYLDELLEGEKAPKMNDSEIYQGIIKNLSEIPGRKILVAHNYFTVHGEELDIMDSERRINIGGEDIINIPQFLDFTYVALGHLHKAQKVGADHVRYAGSIMKYSLSELNNSPSMPYVRIDGEGNVDSDLIPLQGGRDLKRIRGTFEELSMSTFTEDRNDLIHVVLTDNTRVDNAFPILQKQYPNIIRMDYENVRDERFNDIDMEDLEKKSISDLFREYFRSRTSRDMSILEESIINEVLKEAESDATTEAEN